MAGSLPELAKQVTLTFDEQEGEQVMATEGFDRKEWFSIPCSDEMPEVLCARLQKVRETLST